MQCLIYQLRYYIFASCDNEIDKKRRILFIEIDKFKYC